jgi:hypothetical protein
MSRKRQQKTIRERGKQGLEGNVRSMKEDSGMKYFLGA